ncbi:MAG: molybdopterin-guanine dinucleotide biosynthesis protein B [Dehalococcoidia bacterium]|nr:molybdopterin-guanine dinucleotide biosynthesis protein B [Dehalococcoidia bacterium]MBL7166573.1 molybdopterin-guanine dinucleotide biosynthesis protein B [Dehalococcoidales bacterium]
MASIVSIVGKSKSGKTTLLEKLIPELDSRGYQVATIKHTPDDVSLDEPGKDSWRHMQAGSRATIIGSPTRMTLIKKMTPGVKLEEMASLFGEDYDIVLAEGFKQDTAPKIEVHRRETGPPLEGVDGIIAIATDEVLDTEIRQFSLEDIAGLVDLMENEVIRPHEERVSLYVNGAAIPLTTFPRDLIGGVLAAMASCLRGVGEIRSLKFFLRRGRSGQD